MPVLLHMQCLQQTMAEMMNVCRKHTALDIAFNQANEVQTKPPCQHFGSRQNISSCKGCTAAATWEGTPLRTL